MWLVVQVKQANTQEANIEIVDIKLPNYDFTDRVQMLNGYPHSSL